MNIQKYNQRLLAIIGTIVLAGSAIILIIGLVLFISDQFSSRRSPHFDNGIVIDQNQFLDTTDFKFTQQISIMEPYQLDSTKPVFIIPIGQKDQKSRRKKLAAAGMDFNSYSSENYYYSNFHGLYNNFVFIDYERDLKKPIFDSKVAITEWAYLKIDSVQLILFKGTDEDLNNDGRLNHDDFQSLFVYKIASNEIFELNFDHQTVESFNPLSQTSKIYVRTGKDINNDNVFDQFTEPKDLYIFDVQTGESETLVPDDLKKEIQNILN